jgi:hypothetical protein
MTGRAPRSPRSIGPPGSGRREPLPVRPALTTPPHLQRKAVADLQRQHLAAQPRLGIGGMLLAAVVFFALALGTGSTETSLLILGPISTFSLPAVAMIAFWWNDWPGSSLTTPWTGLIDTVVVIAAAVVLTIAGQAIVERSDLRGVFEANPGPGVPTTFPATLALAGAAFTATLQLSLVCERWPLGGIGRLRSGLAALALSWAVGIGAYFLFVNLDGVPGAERAAVGLRNPGGPIPAADFGSALTAIGVWQAVFFIALRGWPVNTITSRPRRLLAGNALVLALGALTYIVLRNGAHWQPAAISAVCGCVISAALIVAMLFEGWPATRLPAGPGRANSRPHSPGGARAQPRPGRLRQQRSLDERHARRLDHHRRPQLHRGGHHLACGHRASLAVRRKDEGELMSTREPETRSWPVSLPRLHLRAQYRTDT